MQTLEELAAVWNEAGRAYFTELSSRLSRLYEDGDESVDLDVRDPRSQELGDRVMRAIIELNAQGRAQRARELFDPAYTPLMGWIEKSKASLGFVAILGPQELLVHRGVAWKPEGGVAFHLRGDEVTTIPDVRGLHRSRSRDWLVLARAAGMEIRDARAGAAALSGPVVATLPWPDMEIFRPRGLAGEVDWSPPTGPIAVEQLACSDDGMRVAVSCNRQGILLASRHPGEPAWTLLWPDARPPFWKDGDGVPGPGDMTHVALSRDGRRIAFGSQDAGHFLVEAGSGGGGSAPGWYATVGHLSEYPHHACFSDDGQHTALNSCHFYNGATVAFAWEGNRGVTLEPYEVHPQAPCIDGGLRVYAACWLDKRVLDAVVGRDTTQSGAFALAGSGILRVCTLDGALVSAQGFGSSASAIDFCPESGRLAVASYSGFVHLYDPYEAELPGRIDGFRARRELARWALWENLSHGPVRW